MNKYAVAGMVSLALAGTVQGAAAQDSAAKSGAPASPWYIGVGIGQTSASIPDDTVDTINAQLSAANASAFTVVDTDDKSTGVKLLVGYRFMRYFAVEGGYAVLGKSKVNMDFRSTPPVSALVGTFDMEYKMSATFIDAVGILPFAEQWSLIGRLGVAYGRTSASFNGSPFTLIGSSDDSSESKVREKFGAGVDYSPTPKFTVRAEWERYKMPDPLSDDDTFNADAATLSFLFRF